MRRALALALAITALVACSSSAEPTSEDPSSPSFGSTRYGEGSGNDGAPAPPADPEPAPPPPLCAGGPTERGYVVDKVLGELALKDCEGNDYPVANMCKTGATWMFISFGWCPVCKTASEKAEALFAEYAGQDVVALNVILEDAAHKPAKASDCAAWKEAYGLSKVTMLYDPTLSSDILDELGSTALNVFIDHDGVIRAKVYGDDPEIVRAGIKTAESPR